MNPSGFHDRTQIEQEASAVHRPSFISSALLAGVAAIAISACGSSPSSSSSAGSSSGGSTSAAATSAAGGGSNSGSSFCQQAVQVANQLKSLSSGLFSGASPGATPSLTTIQQLFNTAAQAIDSLDGSAPSEIATAFHALRSAYDQANTQVQAATSLQEMSTAVTGLDSASLQADNTTITNYFTNVCGITPEATTAPSPTPT